ncbi:MAG: hypothetical protein OEV66_11470 [Spirochaetia bacterium]|nr:hypothetical protein [Spirochaetia bacterium]
MGQVLERTILKIEKFLLMAMICFIVFSVLFRLIARNFPGSGWAIDLADTISSVIPHLVLLLGILGASVGISRSEVIQIDIIKRLLKEKYQKWIQKIVYLTTAALLVLFIGFAAGSIEFGEKNWILFGYIPAFSLLLVKSFLRVLN